VREGRFFLSFRQFLSLLMVGKAFLTFFPSFPAFFKKVIVKPATFFKPLAHYTNLFFGWIDTVFKCFKHSVSTCLNYTTHLEKRGAAALIPSPKRRRVFPRRFDNLLPHMCGQGTICLVFLEFGAQSFVGRHGFACLHLYWTAFQRAAQRSPIVSSICFCCLSGKTRITFVRFILLL